MKWAVKEDSPFHFIEAVLKVISHKATSEKLLSEKLLNFTKPSKLLTKTRGNILPRVHYNSGIIIKPVLF